MNASPDSAAFGARPPSDREQAMLDGAARPFAAPLVTTEPPPVADERVLKEAGAALPRRDAVEKRIGHAVRDGTGHVVNWFEDAGGWPAFPSTASPLPKQKEGPKAAGTAKS